MEDLTAFLTNIHFKGAIILAVALAAVFFMRRSSAAARHWIWMCAIAGVISIPVLTHWLPGWSAVPVVSLAEQVGVPGAEASEVVPDEVWAEEFEVEALAAFAEPDRAGAGGDAIAGISERRGAGRAAGERMEGPVEVVPETAPEVAVTGSTFSFSQWFGRWAPWIWVGGASFALLPLVVGWIGLGRLRRTARPVDDVEWVSLLEELRSGMGVRRKVRLLESPACTMPMTWGAVPGLPAKILVPEDALSEWTVERRRAVLLHELAHVKRRDCLTQLLTQFACALYWCNPLIWIAAHRLLVERERACDDLALRHKAEPADYAKHLLEIATGRRMFSFAGQAAIAMARPSGLGDRVVAVLDRRRNRRALGRLAAVAVIALFGAVVVPVAMLQADRAEVRPNLTGLVTDEGGNPLPGATVFINTAAPREGIGILCPSCYADCAKSAHTDSDGRFIIERLDPELIFEVLVAAEGYRPEFVREVDPFDDTFEVALETVAPGDTPRHRVRGRVVDSNGRPLPGAVAWLHHVTQGERSWLGQYEGFDPVAVANENGEFVIHSREPFEAAGFKVTARGMAPRTFSQRASGDTVHELTLTEGASVMGRVMKDGNPLAGVEVGMTGADRNAFAFVGDHSIATDEDGYFLIVNLPPETEYYSYGSMESLEGRDIISSQSVHVGEDGTTLELGEINVESGYILEGRIRLTDGEPVPEGTRFLLSRQRAWDSVRGEVDAAGRFLVEGVPSEPVTLSARVEGYRPSLGNASLDELNPFGLLGTLYSDNLDMVLELEPGERSGRLDDFFRGRAHEPLRGVEPSAEPDDIRVSGFVVDAETGDPLPSFSVTPGRESERRTDEVDWALRRKSSYTGGRFSVAFQETGQAPVLLIEADGYFSHVSDPIVEPENDLVFEMEKGPSLSGIVLRPDGQPAVGTTVYLAEDSSGAFISITNERVSVFSEPTPGAHSAVTDEMGRFSFLPYSDPYCVMVFDDDGFAEVLVEDVSEDLEVRLQSWARVEGDLMIGATPGANETVRLRVIQVPLAYFPHSAPFNYSLTSRTDGNGEFVFDRVPPLPIQVYHSPRLGHDRGGTIPISQNARFEALPGETHQVRIGGKGRPVVGRIEVAGYDGEIDWYASVNTLNLMWPRPPELSSDFSEFASERDEALRAADTDEERESVLAEYEDRYIEWIRPRREFYASEAGREYHLGGRRYTLIFSPDGRFRIDDVPGGDYGLAISLFPSNGPDNPRTPGLGSLSDRIARLSKTIEIPESPNGRTDEPYDLGVIEVEVNP